MKENKCKIELEGKIPLINTCIDASLEISHPCKKPPKPEPVAEYKRIEMVLPKPPGVPPLPTHIYFDMDTRLHENQVRASIANLLSLWDDHYFEKAALGSSAWSRCAAKYSTKNLTPVWMDKERKSMITDGMKAFDFAMDTFTSFLIQNGTWNAPFARISYLPESSCSNMIGEVGNKQFHVPLDVKVNNRFLTSQSNLILAASLFHAWMHRLGYKHPEGEYTGYLIAEAPMCAMRGYQDKVPGQPDSVFTRYFD